MKLDPTTEPNRPESPSQLSAKSNDNLLPLRTDFRPEIRRQVYLNPTGSWEALAFWITAEDAALRSAVHADGTQGKHERTGVR